MDRQKVGSYRPMLVFFLSVTFAFPRHVAHTLLSDSYLLHGVKKFEKQKMQ